MTARFELVNQWWHHRSARERGLLLLLSTVVAGLAFWYGVASPLTQAAAASDMHRSRAAALLREVEGSRSLIAGMIVPTTETLEDVLKLSAAEAGFALETQSEANEGQTTVRGHASEPAALFAWIEMLRKNHGLTISNLTAERENDGTVRVEAMFVGGGS